MIVPENDGRVELNGNGSATEFPFDFAIIDKTHIQVTVDGIIKSLYTHYDVTGINVEGGGLVIMTIPPGVGVGNVVLTRLQPVSQESIYTENEEYPPLRIQKDFNLLVMGLQQIREMLNRALSFPINSLNKNISIATPVAGQFLRWKDPSGNIEGGTPVTSGSLVVPVSLADGGTGSSHASQAALAKDIGTALWGNPLTGTFDTWTIVANILQVPNPLTNNVTIVSGNLSGMTTTGVRPGTEVFLSFNSAVTLTHSSTFYLLGSQSFTSVSGGLSRLFYNGTAWIEIGRYTPGDTSLLSKPEATRLSYVSGTSLKLLPFKGRGLPIKVGSSWQLRDIGSTGISSGNPTTASNFVNGFSSQSLVAGTTYLVCVFDNSGTLTFDFRTTLSHTQDVDSGVEIATGLPTRTVVGMVRMVTGPAFNDFLTISWFNRRQKGQVTNFTSAHSVSSGTYGEIATEIRNNFLAWSDDAVLITASGGVDNDTVGATVLTTMSIDGVSTEDVFNRYQQALSGGGAIGMSFVKTGLAEGLHFVTLFGSVSSGLGTWVGSSGVSLRTTINVSVRG